jgi:hypothetical protein
MTCTSVCLHELMRYGSRSPGALAVLVLSLAIAAGPLGAAAAEVDDALKYVDAVEQAKGHLLASRQAYRLSRKARAGVHAAHPNQELGFRLWRPLTKIDPDLGSRVQAGLKEPGKAVTAGVPVRDYDAVVDRTMKLLDEAVARAVPASIRDDTRFRAQVLSKLLSAMVGEYGEGIAKGQVVNEVEYQDAWGFFQRAGGLWSALREPLRRTAAPDVAIVDEQMALLGRAMPDVTAPKTVVPTERVKEAVGVITGALERV